METLLIIFCSVCAYVGCGALFFTWLGDDFAEWHESSPAGAMPRLVRVGWPVMLVAVIWCNWRLRK